MTKREYRISSSDQDTTANIEPDWCINIQLSDNRIAVRGKISSIGLKDETEEDDSPYNSAIDGMEALILAHACAGINVEDPAYINGVRGALEAIENHLG